MIGNKIKKKYIVVFLLSILVIILITMSTPNNKPFEIMDDIKFYSTLPDGNLYGLTEKGKVYCCNINNNIIDVLFEESDIIYLGGRDRSLIIHRDGSVYIDEVGGLGGTFIGKVEGAVNGDTSSSHTAIVTDDGKLYVHGYEGSTDWNKLGTGNKFNLDQFQLIELPQKIIKVDCGRTNTFVLTESGELFWTGDMSGKFGYTFAKYDINKQIKDIQSNDTSFFLLDENGNVDLFCNNVDINGDMPTNGLKDIVSLSVSTYDLLAINNAGVLYYSGKDIYKLRVYNGNYISPTKISNISDAREVYCSSMHAYVVKDDKIICVPLDRENRIKQFIHKYNIFAPHVK